MISYFNGSKNHILLIIHVFPSYIFDLNLNQRLIQEHFCLVILYLKRNKKFDDSINMKRWIIIEFDNATENRQS